jgi:hypothetical protein
MMRTVRVGRALRAWNTLPCTEYADLVDGRDAAVLDALVVDQLVELLVVAAKLVDQLLGDDMLGGERDARRVADGGGMPPEKAAPPLLGQLEPHLVVVDARTDGHVVDDLL